MANSLVGVMIITCTPSNSGLIFSNTGNKKANVLPVPVGESKITSFFELITS